LSKIFFQKFPKTTQTTHPKHHTTSAKEERQDYEESGPGRS